MDTGETIEIACDYVRESAKCIAITEDCGATLVWLPKKLAEYDVDARSVTIPEWLAKDRGLI